VGFSISASKQDLLGTLRKNDFLIFLGTVSIYTMVVIGYDRYNVIVKGFSGTKIGMGKALLILVRSYQNFH
jgi:hypothetical protein